jgi:arylsulfatase A-like enzyme
MPESTRPNVLIIYPDQMRYDAMGCAGNRAVRTPHLDRLAREGVFCENAYTSFPLCSPFRASLMTGKYAHSAGIYANHYPIPLDQIFLADLFAKAGYATGYVGKWHLDGGIKHGYVPPQRRLGFQRFMGFNRGHTYFEPIFYRNNDPTPRTSDQFEPDMQTGHMIEFMEESRKSEKPWLGLIAWGIPHPPLAMPQNYSAMYSPADMPVRENTPEQLRDDAAGFLAQYYGLQTAADDNLGRLLSYLDETDQARNTIIYLVSDHGEMANEHGLREKKTYFEASMHVPLIVRWPEKIPGGNRLSGLVDPSVDTMPTLLEMCGIAVPHAVQGRSFAGALCGDKDTGRDCVFYEILKEEEGPEKFPVPERGLRTHQWLYVRREEGAVALYDLDHDRLEMNNLVKAPGTADVMTELDNRLVRHMDETGDRWDIEAHFPAPDFQTHEEGRLYYRELLKRAVRE